jgi:hypothetical protein
VLFRETKFQSTTEILYPLANAIFMVAAVSTISILDAPFATAIIPLSLPYMNMMRDIRWLIGRFNYLVHQRVGWTKSLLNIPSVYTAFGNKMANLQFEGQFL